jgi:hypothetical protein
MHFTLQVQAKVYCSHVPPIFHYMSRREAAKNNNQEKGTHKPKYASERGMIGAKEQ